MEMWKLLACRESLNEALITLEQMRLDPLAFEVFEKTDQSIDRLKEIKSWLQHRIDLMTACGRR